MNLNYKIAVINHDGRADGMARTILDGLSELKKTNGELSFFLSARFSYIPSLDSYVLPKNEFIKFAKEADIVLLFYDKYFTDYELAHEINLWGKTIFIDGSEVGKNRRYDPDILDKISKGEYDGNGKINFEMLRKCKLYFKREKPYIRGIIPLPFGIELKYLKYYDKNKEKNIDFFCVFGQEEYPKLRKYARKKLIKFCKKNNFTYHVNKTKTPDEFYELLSRSKAGISVGGGGFDTLRFWEILGNNCLLITEKVDIYPENSKKLDYKRIWQFNDLGDFQERLEEVGEFLRNKYDQNNLEEEYEKILEEHSSKARVLEIFNTI